MKRLEDWPIWIFFGIFVAGVALLFVSVIEQAREKERFMSECEAHQPRHQCAVLWIQAHPPGQTFKEQMGYDR